MCIGAVDCEVERMFIVLLLLLLLFNAFCWCCCSINLFSLDTVVIETRSWRFSFKDEIFVGLLLVADDVTLFDVRLSTAPPPLAVIDALLFSFSESELLVLCSTWSLSGTSVVSPSAPTINRIHFFFLLQKTEKKQG